MFGRHDIRIEEYKEFGLFAGCTRSELGLVSGAATRLTMPAGKVLAREGQVAHEFILVMDGTADVWRDGRKIAELEGGDFFGELGLVRRIPQPATVVAHTPMSIDVIAQREFTVLYSVLGFVRQRIDEELNRRVAKWLSQPAPVRSEPALVGAS